MKISQSRFSDTYFITLGDDEWLANLRKAGHCLSEQMKMIRGLINDKTTLTALDISRIVESNIAKQGYISTFKGYKSFPEAVCISVNKVLVHGIPQDVPFKDGDVISFDFGVTVNGVAADSARTFIYGSCADKEHQKLINTTKLCLENAIREVKLGQRIGSIGSAIYKTAKNSGFNVFTSFGGHGISLNQVHSSPFISNKSEVDDGVKFQPGMTLAIEPLLIKATESTETKISNDGWTIFAEGICAHEENTIFIHEDGAVEIITKDL